MKTEENPPDFWDAVNETKRPEPTPPKVEVTDRLTVDEAKNLHRNGIKVEFRMCSTGWLPVCDETFITVGFWFEFRRAKVEVTEEITTLQRIKITLEGVKSYETYRRYTQDVGFLCGAIEKIKAELQKRSEELRSEISCEVLGGNQFKADCAKHSLAEHTIICAIFKELGL